MDAQTHYGVILKRLRQIESLSVQMFGKRIGKSTGWVSQVENEKGDTRLSETEFNRIVEICGAEKHREMFRTWVANHNNGERVDRTYDGAVLKFIRLKKDLNLNNAAKAAGLSAGYLSKLERGLRPATSELRKQIMLA